MKVGPRFRGGDTAGERIAMELPISIVRRFNRIRYSSVVSRWRARLKLVEKVKWKIADHLDKKPNYCWANLVTWALGWRPWWWLFTEEGKGWLANQHCRNNPGEGGYCGKCEALGFIPRKRLTREDHRWRKKTRGENRVDSRFCGNDMAEKSGVPSGATEEE
jgi:hypothetical protein